MIKLENKFISPQYATSYILAKFPGGAIMQRVLSWPSSIERKPTYFLIILYDQHGILLIVGDFLI